MVMVFRPGMKPPGRASKDRTLGSATKWASSPTFSVTGMVRSAPTGVFSTTDAVCCPRAKPSGFTETSSS